MDFFIVTLPRERGLTASDAASNIARHVRAIDPAASGKSIVQYPLLNGAEGTLELLVTMRLGSFLEVEAKNFEGREVVVPMGFLGDDQSLALIPAYALCAEAGDFATCGTSFGIGELIQDAIDEGAFSILVLVDDRVPPDLGCGAAAALGVKFFDEHGAAIDFSASVTTVDAATIDQSGKLISPLSSRIYLGMIGNKVAASPQLKELKSLASVVGLAAPAEPIGNAFAAGAALLLGAEAGDAGSFVLEASQLLERIESADEPVLVLFAGAVAEVLEPDESLARIIAIAKRAHAISILILQTAPNEDEMLKLSQQFDRISSLDKANVFSQPVDATATVETVRRDELMRLEKLLPTMLSDIGEITKSKKSFGRKRAPVAS